MKASLKFLFVIAPLIGFVGCSSGQKSTKDITTKETKSSVYPVTQAPAGGSQVAPPAAAQANPPVIVTPSPTLSGGTTAGAPMNQNQMQSMMDQCMSLHKDTRICSQRLMQDCQVSASPTDCQGMMKNIKVLRGQ